MCLTRIHGQCLKSTLSAVGNPLKTKGHLRDATKS